MTLRLGALQDALIDGGTKPDLAAKAAEELASYERDITGIRADLGLLKWMVGTLYPLILAILLKLFLH